MFCKTVRREFPPGTFISTPARVMAILQLCLAFSLMAWQAGYPFMGELFDIKSKLLVYDYVMGAKDPAFAKLFAELPESKKNEVLSSYQDLKAHLGRPFFDKALDSIKSLFFKNSPFKLLWLFFSIVIPIVLLKKVEGATAAVWLLPVVTLCFIVQNRWYGSPPTSTKDSLLFPTEAVIVNEYLRHPLSPELSQQEQELRQGWELYLIKEWAKEEPSADSATFQNQKKKGDFAFNLARLPYLKIEKTQRFDIQQEPYPILALYLFWNLSLALLLSYRSK